MDCSITEREIFLVGVLAVIFILLSLWMMQGDVKRTDLPNGFKRAGLALQLVGTAEGIRQVLGSANNNYRPLLRRSIYKDFVYILAYVILFLSLSLLLYQTGIPTAKWLGLIAAVGIIGAAFFDLIENFRMLETMNQRLEDITSDMAASIRQASLVKWGAFFLTIGLLGSGLLLRSGFISAIGLFFLLSGIVGLAGLRFHQIIPLALLPLGIGLIAIAFTFLVWPADVLRKFCT